MSLYGIRLCSLLWLGDETKLWTKSHWKLTDLVMSDQVVKPYPFSVN